MERGTRAKGEKGSPIGEGRATAPKMNRTPRNEIESHRQSRDVNRNSEIPPRYGHESCGALPSDVSCTAHICVLVLVLAIVDFYLYLYFHLDSHFYCVFYLVIRILIRLH